MKTLLKPFGLLWEFPAGSTVNDISREELRSLAELHQLVLVRGITPPSREEFLEFSAEDPVRDLVQWNFGPVMEMKVDPRAENYLFSREAVPMHWDGAFHEEPRFLLFHCLEAPKVNSGGETLFSHTEKIWQNASPSVQRQWEKVDLTYTTEKKAHYGGSFTTAMVKRHPGTGAKILRYAEPVRSELNPVELEISGLKGEEESFLEEMHSRLYAPEHLFTHEWRDGDILIADNFSLVHGRNAFTESSPRHLRRIQLR